MQFKLTGVAFALMVSAYSLAQAQDIPRLGNGKPDFNGIWERRQARVNYLSQTQGVVTSKTTTHPQATTQVRACPSAYCAP
jgi:hypothetical protein